MTVTAAAAPAAGSDSDSTARVLAVAGIVVGAIGVLTAAFALRRSSTAGRR